MQSPLQYEGKSHEKKYHVQRADNEALMSMRNSLARALDCAAEKLSHTSPSYVFDMLHNHFHCSDVASIYLLF